MRRMTSPSVSWSRRALRWALRGPATSSERPSPRELRLQSMARPLRIFHAFDPRRQAVLLIGGDKTGVSNKLFYAR